MDAKEIFDQFIAEKGLRKTAPRDTIVQVFLKTERHVSTEELYSLVRKKDTGIGYATVARTIKLLNEAGLCRIVDLGDGTLRYEHEYKHDHHDHLVCTKCGMLVEVYDKKLEKIQEDLVRKHGFVQTSHRLNIFGLCPKCQKSKA